MFNAQLFPAPRLAGQLPVLAKSPLIDTLSETAVAPPLLNTTVCAALFVCKCCAGNTKLSGETVILGAALAPVPLKLTVCVPALSATEILRWP